MPKAQARRGSYDFRPGWQAHDAADLAGYAPAAMHSAGARGWQHFTDENLMVAGLDSTTRKRVIRQTLLAVEAELQGAQRRRLEQAFRLWGTVAAGLILRQLTNGGRRTWTTGARGKRGLLDLRAVKEFALPPFMAERSTPDCIWLAQRQALDALLDFTVDVPSAKVRDLQSRVFKPGEPDTTRAPRPLRPAAIHNQIVEVYRFYGVGQAVRTGHGPRAWRLYPWRLWRIDHQFELYGNVRLAGLDWLSASHFAKHIGQARPK